MSYNPNIPQSTSKRTISQRQIQANFQAIYNSFAENHASLATANQGRHRVLVLQTVTDPATTANETAIYQKLVASVPNWFYRPNNSQTPIQMSYPSISVNPALSQQYSFVAGPFVVYGGLLSNPADGTVVNLIPVTTLRYVGLTSKDFTGRNVIVGWAIPTNITGSSFTIKYQVNVAFTRDIYYLAIGN